MSALEPLCHLVGISTTKFSHIENHFVEAILFDFICNELKKHFKAQYKIYFQTMKLTTEKEDETMDAMFIRCIINDMLNAKYYTLPGIAYYTRFPEDVIYEIAMGKNVNPSAILLRKLIELHRGMRPELYKEIIKKMIKEYMNLCSI
jgi:hypothetical protein